MGLETTTLTAAAVWGSTFDEYIERRGGYPMGLETPTLTAATVWAEIIMTKSED